LRRPFCPGDTLYVYTGHDEAPATGTSFQMSNWHVFSTKDMAHWTDHGAVMSLSTFSWASANAWAGQAIERSGRFYWYVPMSHRTVSGFAIGVAVGNSPIGPFTDARGSALITNNMTTNVSIDYDDIDPSAFVDDDGQAYLYWGNTSCKVVRLAASMTETTGSIVYLDLPGFTEAPYINKINGTYYLSYASGPPPIPGRSWKPRETPRVASARARRGRRGRMPGVA
jgi:beta-xylosidase